MGLAGYALSKEQIMRENQPISKKEYLYCSGHIEKTRYF